MNSQSISQIPGKLKKQYKVWSLRRKWRSLVAASGSGGYAGGRRGSRVIRNWIFGLTDPDTDLAERENLIGASRDLNRNSPIARGAISTNVTSVVGSGLKLSCAIDGKYLGLSEEQAANWELNTEREFAMWAETTACDIEDRSNFYELTDIAYRSHLESGDVFALLPMVPSADSLYNTRIQLVEADRVSNKDRITNSATLFDGVIKDERGKHIAYYMTKQHPNARHMGVQRLEWQRVEARGEFGRRNVIHLVRPLRPGQTRGEPYLAPVITALKQLSRYTDAELAAAVVSSMFTVFVKTETGTTQLDPFLDNTGGQDAPEDGSYEMGNAAIVGLAPNESIEIANPGRPSTAFDPFVLSILRQIGVGLELPFELLVKHFTASYTASQGAILEAWRAFLTRRTFLSRVWCQNIYEAWLLEAVVMGRVTAPGFLGADPRIRAAYQSALWTGPSKGQLREDIETKAADMRVASGFSTIQREASLINGSSWEQNHKQRVVERNARLRDGLIEEPDTSADTEDNVDET